MGLSIFGAVATVANVAEAAVATWRRAIVGMAALLPQDCLLCGASSGDALLCRPCEDGLPLLSAECCPVCALPTPGAVVCGACLARPPHFDATVAVFVYGFPVDKLAQQLKFAHRLAIADFLALALLKRGVPSADVMIPLPLSARRLRERGFNQSVEIARRLARGSHIPLQVFTALRCRETVPQSRLPWKARRGNVRGAFECRANLTGLDVLVVDDVMTTGATLDEFARVLKAQGASRVTNLVAVRTLKDQP